MNQEALQGLWECNFSVSWRSGTFMNMMKFIRLKWNPNCHHETILNKTHVP